MIFRPITIPGCFEIRPEILHDSRGYFVKTFRADAYGAQDLVTSFAEEYYSLSKKNVLRGMHFQLPPHDHVKIVTCLSGTIMDVIVDLRVGSPTYAKFEVFELSGQKANILYLPSGIAHGFYVRSDEATVMYKVTSHYDPEHDSGILWNSLGIPWPDDYPIVSPRDQSFLRFNSFQSPFVFRD